MIKWTREVKPSQKLDVMDAFAVSSAVMLIKTALETSVNHFIGSDEGVRIQYSNGLNGTRWDCDMNRHLPLFKVFTESETRARIVCTVRYPRKGETLVVTLEYREAGSEEWKKVESELDFFENDWNNLKNAFHGAFDYDYDYDVYWGIGD